MVKKKNTYAEENPATGLYSIVLPAYVATLKTKKTKQSSVVMADCAIEGE